MRRSSQRLGDRPNILKPDETSLINGKDLPDETPKVNGKPGKISPDETPKLNGKPDKKSPDKPLVLNGTKARASPSANKSSPVNSKPVTNGVISSNHISTKPGPSNQVSRFIASNSPNNGRANHAINKNFKGSPPTNGYTGKIIMETR